MRPLVTIRGRAFALALCLAFGCGASSEQLVRRASYDLACPREQMMIGVIDDRTRAVEGCGRRAVYIASCSRASGTDCTWVSNQPNDLPPGQQTSGAVSQPTTPAQPATPDPVGALLVRNLEARRDTILNCTSGAPADVVGAYSADGTVAVSLAGALSGTPAEACVRAALGPVILDTHATSGVVRRTLAASAVPAPPTAGGETSALTLEAPTRDHVLTGIREVQPSVRACARGQRGVARAEVVVASTGLVASVRVTGTFAGTPEGACVEAAVSRAHFPPFQRPTFQFTYPFNL